MMPEAFPETNGTIFAFVTLFRSQTRNVLDKKYIQNIFHSSLFCKVFASVRLCTV